MLKENLKVLYEVVTTKLHHAPGPCRELWGAGAETLKRAHEMYFWIQARFQNNIPQSKHLFNHYTKFMAGVSSMFKAEGHLKITKLYEDYQLEKENLRGLKLYPIHFSH